ncbi:hypothetical protein SDC9_199462 [bioreactor metagenome]|uniref:Uncharacterized protein n=1 Tax=bioreactor metagenome TaxID=1076179 RepID=A0A645IX93_9ZZZZ
MQRNLPESLKNELRTRLLGGDRERKSRHEPPRPCRLRAARPGNPGARGGLTLLFRRGGRRAPDPIRRAVLQAVSRRDRRPAFPRAFPKGVHSSPVRISRKGDGLSALSRDNVSRGPEKWQVDPPRGDRALSADR